MGDGKNCDRVLLWRSKLRRSRSRRVAHRRYRTKQNLNLFYFICTNDSLVAICMIALSFAYRTKQNQIFF